jgi:hypothetical protein
MHPADHTLQQTNLPRKPCRDAPVNQATAIPAISASPLPHLDRCAAACREEHGGNEYGGLPVNYAVYGDAQRVSSSSKAEECHYRPLDLYELLRR